MFLDCQNEILNSLVLIMYDVAQRDALEYNSKLTLEYFWILKLSGKYRKITFPTISEETSLLFPANAINSLQK